MKTAEQIQKDNMNYLKEYIIKPSIDKIEILEIQDVLKNKFKYDEPKLESLNRRVFMADLKSALLASDEKEFKCPYHDWLLVANASGVTPTLALIEMINIKGSASKDLNDIVRFMEKEDLGFIENLTNEIKNENKDRIVDDINKIINNTSLDIKKESKEKLIETRKFKK